MKNPLVSIFGIVLLNSVGFGIIIPVMPQLLMEVTGQGLSKAAAFGGLLTFSYVLMQFCFASIFGNLGDRFGRRKVLLFSSLIFSLDFLVMGFAPNLTWLFVARVIGGIAASTNSIATAYIADISPKEQRAQNLALVGAAFGTGLILGPVLGGFLGQFGSRVPFFAASAVGAAIFLYTFFVLKESLPESNRRPFSLARANPFGAFFRLEKTPFLRGFVLVVFIYSLGGLTLSAIWPYYTIERFRWSPQEIGYSLAFLGALTVFTTGYLTRFAIPRFGEKRTAFIGLSCALVAQVLYAVFPFGWMMYVAMIPGALSLLTMPSLLSLMIDRVPADSQGELQGVVASAGSLAVIINTPMMTQLFSYFTQSSAVLYLPGAAFLLAAVLITISIGTLYYLFLKLESECVSTDDS